MNNKKKFSQTACRMVSNVISDESFLTEEETDNSLVISLAEKFWTADWNKNHQENQTVEQEIDALIQNKIQNGAFVDAVDENGKTALHYAVEYGFKDAVKSLLDAGALVDVKDNALKTPLDYVYEQIDEHLELEGTSLVSVKNDNPNLEAMKTMLVKALKAEKLDEYAQAPSHKIASYLMVPQNYQETVKLGIFNEISSKMTAQDKEKVYTVLHHEYQNDSVYHPYENLMRAACERSRA